MGKGGKGKSWSSWSTTGTHIYRVDYSLPVSKREVDVDVDDTASNGADESAKIDETNGGPMKTSDSCQVSEVVKSGTGDMVAKQDVSTRCPPASKMNTSATPSTTDGSSTSGAVPSRGPKLVTRVAPFDPAAVDFPINLDDALKLELRKCDGPLYNHMIEYLSKRVTSPRSLRLGWRKSLKESDEEVNDNASILSDCSVYGPNHGKVPTTELGLGLHEILHEFEDEKKRKIYVLFQTLGMPVGGYGSACLYTSLILLMKEESKKHTRGLLEEFLGTVWRLSTKVNKSEVAIWRFDIKDSFWSKVTARKPRDFSLVVLEKEMKKLIVEDLSWFLRKDTCDFYAQHGIPYHRAYLFYGAPGAGKTSTIFALAGQFERNLCFLQASVQMTDDSFRLAIGQAPPKSIIVMEDVDALFTVHRESNTNHSLSFSGFLNAIDGLASSDDVIFVLTTNHPERLDPALLRPGRVDVRVEFKAPNMEMAKEYFLTYYPDADDFALKFAKNTSREHSQVSMAQMQHYFLYCHRHQYGAEKAATEVTSFPWNTPVGREVNNMMY